jgi:hypothetical protein
MVLKNVFAAAAGAALLAWGIPSTADEYRADQFLGLDLSKALLSSKPLGPPAHFEPVPIEAKADAPSEAMQAQAEPKVAPHVSVSRTGIAHAHTRPEKPRSAARTRLVRRHGNPLDAQAFDTRIQVWPCKSGGICNWRRQGN